MSQLLLSCNDELLMRDISLQFPAAAVMMRQPEQG
jgi:hypothetical protein